MFFFTESTKESRLREAQERAIRIIEFCDTEDFAWVDSEGAFFTPNTITSYQRILKFASTLSGLSVKNPTEESNRVEFVKAALVVLVGARDRGVVESAKDFSQEEQFISQFASDVDLIDHGFQAAMKDGSFVSYPYNLILINSLDTLVESVDTLKRSFRSKSKLKNRKISDESHFFVIDAMGILIEAQKSLELGLQYHTMSHARTVIENIVAEKEAAISTIEAEKTQHELDAKALLDAFERQKNEYDEESRKIKEKNYETLAVRSTTNRWKSRDNVTLLVRRRGVELWKDDLDKNLRIGAVAKKIQEELADLTPMESGLTKDDIPTVDWVKETLKSFGIVPDYALKGGRPKTPPVS